jgi:ribosomal protein L40E
MDFLEDLFDLGDRKRRNRGGIFQNGDHHDDDHHDDHEHHPNQGSTYPQVSMNSPLPGNQQFSTAPAASLTGVVCRNCSTQTVQGAKFCHGCGTAIDIIQTCASCGSKLPARALFCAQCGYKNG